MIYLHAHQTYSVSHRLSFLDSHPNSIRPHWANKMLERLAQWSDLDAMTWIAVDAFADDPVDRYSLPKKKEYPEDLKEFTRLSLQEFMYAPDCEVRVLEVRSIENSLVKKVVAFSVWQMPKKYIKDRPRDENRQFYPSDSDLSARSILVSQ